MALAKEDLTQIVDEIERRGKEMRNKIGVRAFYAGIGAIGALVIEWVVRGLL